MNVWSVDYVCVCVFALEKQEQKRIGQSKKKIKNFGPELYE